MVPAIRRIPPAARRHDGRAARRRLGGLPPLPPRRTDGDDRRLPGGPPGARGRPPPAGGRGPPVARALGDADGRIPRLGRVPRQEPRAGAGQGQGARARARGGIPAGPVRPHRADAADPADARRRVRGRLAWRSGRHRSRRILVGGAGREPRAGRLSRVRLLQRRTLFAGPRRRAARGRDPANARSPARTDGDRSRARHGRLRSRGTRPAARGSGLRCPAVARIHRRAHRRPREPPRRAHAAGGASRMAGRTAIVGASAPAPQRLLGAAASEARAWPGRVRARAVRGATRGARPATPPRAAEELDRAWLLLLWNGAHDSACGCSHDRVARDVDARFAEARGIGEERRPGQPSGSGGSDGGRRHAVVQPLALRARRRSRARLARRSIGCRGAGDGGGPGARSGRATVGSSPTR